MENTHQKSSAEFKILDGQKTDFNQIFANLGYILNKAMDTFKKDPTNFLLAFAIPVVVGGILTIILTPLLWGSIVTGGLTGGLISLLIYVFCSIVLSIVAYVALLKAVIDVSKGIKLNILDLFRFGFANVISFVILGVKVLLTIFTGVKKFLNSLLASIYFVENGGKVEESIKSSQATVEGKTFTLVWTLILVGLVTGIAGSVLAQIWVSIFHIASYQLAVLGSYVINGLVTPFAIICQFVLREELHKHGGHHAAPEHHAPTHHHTAS